MRKLITAAHILRLFIGLVRNPEGNLDQVLELLGRLEDADGKERLLAALPRTPQTVWALEHRPAMRPLDLEALAALPEGSLGHAYATFLSDHGFDPNDLPPLKGDDDGAWAITHLRQTHDLWHVLTGFETDTAGEAGLQAVYLAQVNTPLALILLAGILLNGLRQEPAEVSRRMDAITAGWQLGRQSGPIFGQAWGEQWQRSLVDVREELGIKAVEQLAAAA